MIIAHDKLRDLTRRIVAAGGSAPEEVEIVADHLIEANLRGHDSHGVGMLVAYVRDIGAGTLKANQAPEIVSDNGVVAVWDAHAGYGQVIARQAVEWAIEAAAAQPPRTVLPASRPGGCAAQRRDSMSLSPPRTQASRRARRMNRPNAQIVADPASAAPHRNRNGRRTPEAA